MIICYLPPIKGTRKLHWFPSVSIIPNCCWKQELVKGLSRNRLDTDSSNPQAWQSLPSNPCCHLGGKTLVNKKWIKFWQMITLPKTNIAPWKDEFPFEKAHFQGLCLVSRRGKLSDLCLVFFTSLTLFRTGFGPSKDIGQSASPNVQLAPAWRVSQFCWSYPKGIYPQTLESLWKNFIFEGLRMFGMKFIFLVGGHCLHSPLTFWGSLCRVISTWLRIPLSNTSVKPFPISPKRLQLKIRKETSILKGNACSTIPIGWMYGMIIYLHLP